MSEKQSLPAKHDHVSPASPEVIEQAPEASPFLAGLFQRSAVPPPIKPKQSDVLHLQRVIGNTATQRYLHISGGASKTHLQRDRIVEDDLRLSLPATLPSYDEFVALVSQQRALRARMIARSDGGEHILSILRDHSNLAQMYQQIGMLYSSDIGSGGRTLHARLHYEDSPGDAGERVDHIEFSLPGLITLGEIPITGSLGTATPVAPPPAAVPDDSEYGLEASTSRDTFVTEAVSGLVPRWPSMTPDQRREAVFDLINARLAALGIPPVSPNPVSALSPGTNAQFGDLDWSIDYVETRFEVTSAAEINHLLSDFYHEARHAEQVFLGLRYFYSVVGRMSVEWLRVLHYPTVVLDAALAANASGPLVGAELTEGRQYYEVYIRDTDITNAVLTELDNAAYDYEAIVAAPGTPAEIAAARQRREAADAAYHALVNEIDAYDVGNEVHDQLDVANPGP